MAAMETRQTVNRCFAQVTSTCDRGGIQRQTHQISNEKTSSYHTIRVLEVRPYLLPSSNLTVQARHGTPRTSSASASEKRGAAYLERRCRRHLIVLLLDKVRAMQQDDQQMRRNSVPAACRSDSWLQSEVQDRVEAFDLQLAAAVNVFLICIQEHAMLHGCNLHPPVANIGSPDLISPAPSWVLMKWWPQPTQTSLIIDRHGRAYPFFFPVTSLSV